MADWHPESPGTETEVTPVYNVVVLDGIESVIIRDERDDGEESVITSIVVSDLQVQTPVIDAEE